MITETKTAICDNNLKLLRIRNFNRRVVEYLKDENFMNEVYRVIDANQDTVPLTSFFERIIMERRIAEELSEVYEVI